MARSKSKNVGLIGLGIIGSRVATALRKRGLQVFVWNRTRRPEQYFVGSPVEVAELCDVVQIFVADDTALLETARQLTPGLTAQHIVTAHCTVAPETMRAAAGIVERRGARFLEAPFTGSKVAAENGQLVYYIGGDELALKQARPVLEASSKEIIVIGEIGDASVMKVATNIVTAATAQIAAEALALLGKAGVSPDLFARAMKSNASNSTTLEMKVPLMLAGDFEPHFSVKHMLKDVRIAAKLAREFSLDLPVTEVSSDMLLAELKKGRGDADYSSVAQKYFSGPQEIVRPEPRKVVESLQSAEPVSDLAETRSAPPEPVAEARPADPATKEAAPIRVDPVAETSAPKPAFNAVPPIPAQPVAETKPPEPESAIYEAPPIPSQSVAETESPKLEPVINESPPIAAGPATKSPPPEPLPAISATPPVAGPVAKADSPAPEPIIYRVPEIAVEPIAEGRPTEPKPVMNVVPPITPRLVIESKPEASRPQPQESPLMAAKPAPESASGQTGSKAEEPSSISVVPTIKAKPARVGWIDDEEDEDEDIPPGVNLSGGIRGWFSRRLSRRRP
jgi:3-hydroxyisobutyrate dehydrogenase-like beta-hydroxyacid dehydrogenase